MGNRPIANRRNRALKMRKLAGGGGVGYHGRSSVTKKLSARKMEK